MEKSQRNIIFSDLFGTLISENEDLCNENLTYNDEFKNLANFLNQYLEGDNVFAIVSNPDHVCCNTYIEIFDKIVKLLEPSKVKKLYSIISNSKPMSLVSELTGYKVNFYPMYTKADALTILFSQIGIGGNLIAIGDNSSDIPMLIKTSELGGKSFFNINPIERTMDGHGINENYNNFSTSQLIHHLAKEKTYYIELHEQWVNEYQKLEKYLQEQYNFGNINREQLIKEIELLYIANLYDFEIMQNHHLMDKSIVDSFEINNFAEKCDKKLTLVHGMEQVLPTLKKYTI